MYEMGRDIHTRVLRSEKGCKIRVTLVHTRSDCVHTREDAVRLDYASRYVRVIYSSHIVSIQLGTVTHPSVVGDWQYTNDRTVQLQWGYPNLSKCRFLAELPAIVQTLPSARPQAVLAARMSLGVATPLSAKFFETMLSTPARAWRCHPHAPSFQCSSGSALCTCPDDASHASNVASPASVSLQFWHCFSQVL